MANAAQAPANAEGPTSHTLDQARGLAKLREDFPPGQILPLPKVTCRACSNAPTRECGQHRKSKCPDCKNYITNAHVHLDYVGHAELTARLLDADPLWNWEPLAIGPDGLPVFDANGGLWIRLTVCGHTRLGYGDAQGKKGPNAVKEAIGDALRNAAMRFGAALDLWAKSDLRQAQAEHPKDEAEDVQATASQRLAQIGQRMRVSWDSLGDLRKVRVLATEWSLLDEELAGPTGELFPVSVLLDERVRELSQARRDASQGQKPTGPEDTGQGEGGKAGSEDARAARLNAFIQQVQRSWENPLALGQVKEAAQRDGLLDAQAQGPDGQWTTLQGLIDGRMAALAAPADAGGG